MKHDDQTKVVDEVISKLQRVMKKKNRPVEFIVNDFVNGRRYLVSHNKQGLELDINEIM